MNYFILAQDESIWNFVEPVGVTKVITKEMLKWENLHMMDELPVQFDVKTDSKLEYIDFLEKPFHIVSDGLKKILKKYDDYMFFKPLVFYNPAEKKQHLYWIMVPESIDCLSDKTEYNKNGTIKKLVIKEEKTTGYKIFKIKGIAEDLIVITLDVAESLLRRDYTGISLKKVQKES